MKRKSNMEEGFGQASFKTFVLDLGLLSGLGRGFVTSGTSGLSFDLKKQMWYQGVLL